jgi:hypothetical protein
MSFDPPPSTRRLVSIHMRMEIKHKHFKNKENEKRNLQYSMMKLNKILLIKLKFEIMN